MYVNSLYLVHSVFELRTTALRHASVLVQHLEQGQMDLKPQKEAIDANEGTDLAWH